MGVSPAVLQVGSARLVPWDGVVHSFAGVYPLSIPPEHYRIVHLRLSLGGHIVNNSFGHRDPTTSGGLETIAAPETEGSFAL